jgi:hypothetical protein
VIFITPTYAVSVTHRWRGASGGTLRVLGRFRIVLPVSNVGFNPMGGLTARWELLSREVNY